MADLNWKSLITTNELKEAAARGDFETLAKLLNEKNIPVVRKIAREDFQLWAAKPARARLSKIFQLN